jgi:hypothetical protein
MSPLVSSVFESNYNVPAKFNFSRNDSVFGSSSSKLSGFKFIVFAPVENHRYKDNDDNDNDDNDNDHCHQLSGLTPYESPKPCSL